MRSTRTPLRRAWATAVLVPVLALSGVACGGGDGGTDGGSGGDSSGGTTGGGSDSGGEGDGDGGETTGGQGSDGGETSGGSGGADDDGGLPPLTAKQLKKALLKTGDVKGYKAQRNDKDPLPAENTMEADRPECEAIADTVDSKPSHRRTAYTGGVIMKGDFGTGSTVQQVLLSAYEKGEAAAWLDELATSLEKCRTFTGKVGTGEQAKLEIEPGASVGIGDDSVQFTMKDAKGKDSPTVFTVVRAGNNTATFMSIAISGKPTPVARPVVVKQHEKLTAAGRAG